MTIVDHADVRRPVEYPEADGSRIAESDWHRNELFDLIYRLESRYADHPDIYVSGHMFVYFEEGEPSSVFAPDAMVVFGVPKKQRRVFKLWEEGRAPSVVFEVSSRSTWVEDRGNKRALCERLGVAEYFLWDPRYEYLTPPLQGLRLVGEAYRQIRPDAKGCLISTRLDLRLCCEQNRLELYDRRTGERLNRPADLDAAARKAVADAGEAAAESRRALTEAERARREVEAENERLRAEVARLRGEG